MISLILPAARSQERAQRIVDLLRGGTRTELEIVVTSPGFKLLGATNVLDEMVGSSRAIAQAYLFTDPLADHVAWLSDICLPTNGCLDRLVAFVDAQCESFIAEPRTLPYRDGFYRTCTICGHQYARWGMMSRRTVELCGGFFDERYVSYYGDVDLSLRCWKAGGTVETCKDATIEMDGQRDAVTTGNWAKSRERDTDTFVERWGRDYPAVAAEHDSVWNVDRELAL